MIDAGRAAVPKERAQGEVESDASLVDGPWSPVAAFGPAILVTSQALGLRLVRFPTKPAAVSKPVRLSGMEFANQEQRMTERLDLHDFSAALEISEAILIADSQHSRAMAVRDECRKTLQAMYLSRLQDARAVPRVKLEPDEIIWLGLDHRAGFVLSQVDGVSSYDEIVEVSGMDRLECLKILVQLTDVGVITAMNAPTFVAL
jgi:hypothetical protein